MKLQIENSPPVKTGGHGELFTLSRGIQKELSVRIYSDEDPVAGLRRAWGAAVALAEEFHEGPLKGTPKEVHFLRLTVKRLRSYLQLVRAELDPEDFRNEDSFLRDTARSLAGSRDFVMGLRTIERLGRFAAGSGERKALAKLSRLLENGETGAGGGASESTQDATARAVARLQESVGRFDLVRGEASGWDRLEVGLERAYSKARKRFARWEKTGDVETAHRCRRFSKYLGFHLELLETKGAKDVRHMRGGLARLQRKLGRMNDLVVLEERVEAMAGEGLLGRKARKRFRRVLGRARKRVARAGGEAGGEVFGGKRLPAGLIPPSNRDLSVKNRSGGTAGGKVEKRPI